MSEASAAAASKSEDIDIAKQQQQPNGLQNGHVETPDELAGV